jgi:hypothetical protein
MPAMHSPNLASSHFLAIAVESEMHEISFVARESISISGLRKNRNQESLQSEKEENRKKHRKNDLNENHQSPREN